MSRVVLHCSLCGNEIDPHSDKLHKLDPCGLYIVTNILEEDDGKRLEQAVYCHYNCIKGVMANEDYLNLEDQDLEEGSTPSFYPRVFLKISIFYPRTLIRPAL